jgi:protein-S-isoprenylcysteine O-methyltransferase Ste14
MPQQILGWFPSASYANLYGIIVLICLLSDEIVPRLVGGKGISFGQGRDRGSFLFIYLFSLAGLFGSVHLRFLNIGVVPFWIQVLGLIILIVGALVREWAIALLGRFFARTVEIEKGHRLITDGPYRLVRHPAYTGMVMMYAGIVLGLATWVGTAFMLLMTLIPTVYRIRVEEKVLVENFGEQYLDYMHRTWRIFPGW